MDVMIHIPDDLASRLGSDLSRRALEALALEEFRRGRLTGPELRQLLGFATRAALDGFLKAHGVFLEYGIEDLERDREDLRRLGLLSDSDHFTVGVVNCTSDLRAPIYSQCRIRIFFGLTIS